LRLSILYIKENGGGGGGLSYFVVTFIIEKYLSMCMHITLCSVIIDLIS